MITAFAKSSLKRRRQEYKGALHGVFEGSMMHVTQRVGYNKRKSGWGGQVTAQVQREEWGPNTDEPMGVRIIFLCTLDVRFGPVDLKTASHLGGSGNGVCRASNIFGENCGYFC